VYPKPAPPPISATDAADRAEAVALTVRHLLARWPVNSTAYYEGRAYDVVGVSGSFCVGVAGNEVRAFLHLRSAEHPALVFAIPPEACSTHPPAAGYGPAPVAGLYHLWAFAVGPLGRARGPGGQQGGTAATDPNQKRE